MMPTLPSGTVTFLFTDIEGSTRRWERDPAAMAAAVDRHLSLLDGAVAAQAGAVYKVIGDAVQAAFARPTNAVAAALAAQLALAAEPWPATGPLRVRMAIHVGEAAPRGGDYLAPCLNRLARLLAAGHGGQVLLTHAVALTVRGALPAGAALRDLGTHRLRDLLEPEHVFQLLHPDMAADFPPLRSLTSRLTNLPIQPTPFLGREQALAGIADLLHRDGVRLVTLTGPGGVGKTRLALQAAADAVDAFEDGAWFVGLAAIRDPQQVLPAVANALGVREEGDEPLVARLAAHLRTRRILLLLDNVEQVAEGATSLTTILAEAPDAKVLATSRAPLHVYGEQEFPVEPLALPDAAPPRSADEAMRIDAVRFFTARAQAAVPDFAVTDATAATVTEICRRLDGLPLAIELAAARVKFLRPPALLPHLERRLSVLTGGPRDRPARQQTMREAIAWSHALLGPEEQKLFGQVAVFAGGFPLPAVEAVVSPGERVDPFGPLAALVDQSLLRHTAEADGPRFAMLETVREFALECLEASGEGDAVRQRHAAWCLSLAERAEPELDGPEQGHWLAQLEREHDNLRAALAWLQTNGDAERSLRLGGALGQFWEVRGYLSEGRRWLNAALAMDAAAPPAVRAKAARRSGRLASRQGDFVEATALFEESLALSRAAEDAHGVADALHSLGVAAHFQGNSAAALGYLEEGLALRRGLGDETGVSSSLNMLATVAHRQGRFGRAERLYEESLAARRRLGDARGIAASLNNLANVLRRRGEHARAAALYEESLALRRALGDKPGIASSLANLARAAQDLGDVERATALYEEAVALRRELGDAQGAGYALAQLGGLALVRTDPERAAAAFDACLSLARRVDLRTLASCLDGVAAVEAARAEQEPAARLLAAAARLRKDAHARVPREERGRRELVRAQVRAELGRAAFTAATAVGEGWSLDAALAAARAYSAAVSGGGERNDHWRER